MRTRLLALALFVAMSCGGPSGLARAAGSWPVGGHDSRSSNFNPDELAVGGSNVARLHAVWSVPNITDAIATSNRVFALTSGGESGRVLDLAAGTGAVLHSWTPAHLGLPAHDVFEALATAGGSLLVASNHAVLAIDPVSGLVRWRTPGGAMWLTVDGQTVYTGKGCQFPCGALASYALDLRTGHVLWQHNGNFGGPPVVIAGRLYQVWGEMSGETRVYDAAGGQILAHLPIDGRWTGDSTAAYAFRSLGMHSALAALQRIGPNGRPVWSVSLGAVSSFSGGPVVAYGAIFTASNRFHPGVIAVGAGAGRILWGADLGPSLTLACANHLLFALHTVSGALDVLDAGTGRTLVHLPVKPRGVGSSGVLIAGGTVYVIEGGLTALRP